VLFLPLPDELLGGCELPADLGEMAAVGREMVASVAGFSELTVLASYVRF
jgi:hypothetical protein